MKDPSHETRGTHVWSPPPYRRGAYSTRNRKAQTHKDSTVRRRQTNQHGGQHSTGVWKVDENAVTNLAKPGKLNPSL